MRSTLHDERNASPPEMELWRAVLMQAKADLMGQTSLAKPLAELERHRVIQWTGTQDFYTVCNLAGLNPVATMAAFDALAAAHA